MKILCVIPSLSSELKMDTLQSIFNQTIPITSTIILTERVQQKLMFPAKMSLILNHMLDFVQLEKFDYLLRVDSDTILPNNFLEENLKGNFDVLGEGYAQLIKVSSFQKYLDGKFFSGHDDGYILVKMNQLGLKVSHRGYLVKPLLKREPGLHQGSSWYFSQGDLKYRYGWEPVALATNIIYNHCVYGVFEGLGYFVALFKRKKRFDVAQQILDKQLMKYRYPSRFLRIGKFGSKILLEKIL